MEIKILRFIETPEYVTKTGNVLEEVWSSNIGALLGFF